MNVLKTLRFALPIVLTPFLAVAHPGGLNKDGCHAGSKPYHCHRSGGKKSKAASGGEIEGRVIRVRDVDTIVVGTTPVRLHGVDGPELSTKAGRDAKGFMERRLKGKTVRCRLTGKRTYDRLVGVCHLNGEDIGAMAIGEGHALDCARYSGGAYRHLETPSARSRLKRAGYC